MPVFKYRAKDGPERIVENKIEAQSEAEVVERLSQMGYIPLSIEEEKKEEKKEIRDPVKNFGRIKSRDITIFSRQLASLLKAGVPILKALDIISEQCGNSNLQNCIKSIHDSIKEGASFSTALILHSKVFSQLYIAMVRTGEDSGTLPEVLLRISDYRAKQDEMMSRFKMAMAYPILMALVGLGTIIFMFTFVMPRLMRIFISMGQDLPLPTQILISISKFMQKWWLGIIVFMALAYVIMQRELKTKAGRMSVSIFRLGLPVYGTFVLKSELARFCRTMEMLIKEGVPILRAIDVAIPVLDNEIIKKQLIKGYKELEQGSSLGQTLKGSRVIPIFMSNLIIVGEESGKLDEAFGEISNSYERDIDETIRILASLIEPLMILVMGLIVGFIVVAMLLPIFEINVITR